MASNGMADYAFILNAGQQKRLNVPGTYFHVVQATGSIGISFDDGAQINRVEGMGGSASYREVTVYSPIDQTVVVALGNGIVNDSRASVSGAIFNVTVDVPNSSPITADVTLMPGVTTQVIAPNDNRQTVNIFAGENNVENLRIGCNNSVGPTNGGILSPGGNGELSTKTGLWVYNPGEASETITLIELEQL